MFFSNSTVLITNYRIINKLITNQKLKFNSFNQKMYTEMVALSKIQNKKCFHTYSLTVDY